MTLKIWLHRLCPDETLYQIWVKWAIRGGIIAILMFDLMTLNMFYVLNYGVV